MAEVAACDVAVAGIGGILPTLTTVGAGYFGLEKFLELGNGRTSGCLLLLSGRGGEPLSPGLLRAGRGITLEQLRAAPRVIEVATGTEKVASVAAVLKGGCLAGLVCDNELAETLLKIDR